MKLTQEAIDLIKQFEGLRLKAYQDQAGVLTIGYGHTKGVTEGMKITKHGAKQLLIEDLARAHAAVDLTINKPMTDYEFGAFVSLTHNIGVGAFARSTAARKFNKGDKGGAAAAILLFNKITVDGVLVYNQGLANRREIERRYFFNVVEKDHIDHYETTAGEGGEHKGVPPAWPIIGALVAAVALFFNDVKEFFFGLF